MKFSSNEELCAAARELILALKARGAAAPAGILHDGFGCINGLTDGWAIFLDAIIEVQEKFGHQLPDDEKQLLKNMHDAAYEAVYRRKPEWWKLWAS